MGRIFTQLTGTGRVGATQLTTSLPVSSGTAAELSTSNDMVVAYAVYVQAAFYMVRAASAAAAGTAIGAGNAMYLPAGFYVFEVAGLQSEHIYIRSAGSAVANGLSYSTIEAN